MYFIGVFRFFFFEYFFAFVSHAVEGFVVFVGDEIARVARHRSHVTGDDFVQVFELGALDPETSTCGMEIGV